MYACAVERQGKPIKATCGTEYKNKKASSSSKIHIYNTYVCTYTRNQNWSLEEKASPKSCGNKKIIYEIVKFYKKETQKLFF